MRALRWPCPRAPRAPAGVCSCRASECRPLAERSAGAEKASDGRGYPQMTMPFPQTRPRRLRATRALRGLVRETSLTPADLAYPMFVAHGLDRREPVEAMPGVDRLSIAHAVD